MQITKAKTWTIPDEIMNEIAHDLISTAIEGGINYWAHVKEYRWGDKTLGHSDKSRGEWTTADKPYISAKIYDDDTKTWHVVDEAKMVEAMIKVVKGEARPFYNSGYSKTYRDRLAALLDEIEANPSMRLIDADYDYDSSDADCMMQLAVLGDVIYG